MDLKTKYWFYELLDWGLSVGGTMGVIIYDWISPQNPPSYKIGILGIMLVIVFLFTCKYIFEKQYQKKTNELLESLATATDNEVKAEIKKQIKTHEMKNDIFIRLMMLLPFLVLSIVCAFSIQAMESLQGTVNMVLTTLGAGSVFNVIKKPLKKELNESQTLKKVEKNKKG